jgi:predicted enzyme related to lactoylglutathione lyase
MFQALLLLSHLAPLQAAPVFEPSVFGLELPVRDVAAAERAYAQGFGFRVLASGGELARLEKDGLTLVLSRSDAPPAAPGTASVHLNLEAGDLDAAIERALAAGFEVPELEPRVIPIGRSVTVLDADGHATNLIELDEEGRRDEEGLTLFNLGLDLEAGADWEFVERLGFRVSTRAYVPDALPTLKAGAAELVLHREAEKPRTPGTKAAAVLLGVERLEPALAALASAGFADATALPRASAVGRRASLQAPSALRLELVERSPAQLAFERLCTLAGTWEGESSAGWTARIELEVIARGSVLLERSNFEAHPGETMLTLFHRDGAELVLTHYCVAGNQPRLVATEIGPDSLRFTFRDATNLAARDQGHMDEALLRFEGSDTFSSQWSFFQNGKTSWMEEIHYRRISEKRHRGDAEDAETRGEEEQG